MEESLALSLNFLHECSEKNGHSHESVGEAHYRIGMAFKKYADSVNNYEQKEYCINCALVSFESAERVLAKFNPNDSMIVDSIIQTGRLLMMQEFYEKALTAFQRGLKTGSAQFGKQSRNPLIAEILNDVGLAHQQMGDYRKGKGAFMKSLKIQCSFLTCIDRTQRNDTHEDDFSLHSSVIDEEERITLYDAKLKLAEINFNIGVLCLERMKRHQSSNPKKDAIDAYRFIHLSHAIRKKELGAEHPETTLTQDMRYEAKWKTLRLGAA